MVLPLCSDCNNPPGLTVTDSTLQSQRVCHSSRRRPPGNALLPQKTQSSLLKAEGAGLPLMERERPNENLVAAWLECPQDAAAAESLVNAEAEGRTRHSVDSSFLMPRRDD